MFGRSTAVLNALGASCVFCAAFVLHIDNLEYALLGWDTYATIITSRIETWPDFWGTFSEVMMDGRLLFGDFYRPIGNLLIAFDYAIWGLDPFGYQLTSLVLWALSASLVFLLARRHLGDESLSGPIAAAVLYVLHPAVLSILSVAARQTETLQTIFILLTLLSLPVSEAERGAQRYLLAGIFAALAVASKETGIIALPLAFIHQLLTNGRAAVFDRVLGALRAVIPAITLIAGIFVARFLVIGGMGGYHAAASMSVIDRILSFSPKYLQTLTVTGTPGRTAAAGLICLSITLVLVLMAVWLVCSSRQWSRDRRSRVLGLATIGACWLIGQVGLVCLSFQFSPRYLVGMVAGLSLVFAALIDGIRLTAAIKIATSRLLLAVPGTTMAAAIMPGLAGCSLWYDYPGFAEASRIQKSELQTLAEAIGKLPPLGRMPVAVRRQVGSMDDAVDHAWMLSPWGLQAWLDMAFPDKSLRVAMNTDTRQSRTHWHLILIPAGPDDG